MKEGNNERVYISPEIRAKVLDENQAWPSPLKLEMRSDTAEWIKC